MMKPGRKQVLGLDYNIPDNNDSQSEESRVIVDCLRNGSMDIFYSQNPERLLIEEEERPLREQLAEAEALRISHLVDCITSRLNERQVMIWQLRAEEKSFREIARALGCSERTVYKDWKDIRRAAWDCISSE